MSMTSLIGVDWGTTNARAFRYDHMGTVIEQRHRRIGLLNIKNREWEAAFREHFGDWIDGAPTASVILCGMVGSQQGWSEAPYVACPVNKDDLGANLYRIPNTEYFIVPGVRSDDSVNVPDVMRGEETQIVGLNLRESQIVCLPGTHSKWVRLENGVITAFQTYLTGELFQVLSNHSILSRTLEERQPSESAFLQGLDDSNRAGGLLHQLFGVRGLRLFGKLSGSAQSDYLSGLLIGNEVRSALDDLPPIQPITLVGSDALVSRYEKALQYLGHPVEVINGEQAASQGLWQIAIRARLIKSP